MKTVHVINSVVVGVVSVSDGAVNLGVAGATDYVVDDNLPAQPGWMFVGTADVPAFAAPAPVPPTVSPPTYMLLFTGAERIAIKAKRATDPVLGDFFDIIDDARLTEVVLSLKSVQDGTSYALEQAGVAAADVPARLAQILTGVLQ